MVFATGPICDGSRLRLLATLDGGDRIFRGALSSAHDHILSWETTVILLTRWNIASALSNGIIGTPRESFPGPSAGFVSLLSAPRIAIFMCFNGRVQLIAGLNSRISIGGGSPEGEEENGGDVDFHCEYFAYLNL